MNAYPSKERVSGKFRPDPRFGPTALFGEKPEPVLVPNQAKLCVSDESINIGVVDQG